MNIATQDVQGLGSGTSRVVAVFEDSYVSFALPKGATLGELAERLAAIAEPHGGLPTALDVRVRA
jgi:hypothetical protein